nr:hypothetical protein BJQ95_01787 [Cryobacterium sp. SO1]
MDQVREQEVHRPKPQDGKRVRGEDQERFTSDGEDSRDRVNGEDDVRDLHQHQHGQQRGRHHDSCLADQKPLPVVRVGHRHEPAKHLEDAGILGVDVVVAGAEHPPPGVNQERGEDVQDPREVLDQRGAGRDENPAEDQGAQDAQKQHSVLVLARDRESGEDNRPDEHVVDREGFLDQVASEVLLPEFRPPQRPHQHAERRTESHPHDRPHRGFPHTDHVSFAVGDQVDGEHQQDHTQNSEPRPQGDSHDKDLHEILVKVSSTLRPCTPEPAAGTY